ncbi:MAG: ribonuclease HII [Bacteroidota bacterium]
MLEFSCTDISPEAGIDEAGRGCLAGPVVAAAVILPNGFTSNLLNDSKKLSESQRLQVREQILAEAVCWGVGMISAQRIDEVNILNATYEAMHEAIASLQVSPHMLAIDGNRFRAYPDIPHRCEVKGDGRFLNIAAASVLAKTYRDELMAMLDKEFPQYGWAGNKGYPTKAHKVAIAEHGQSPYHRLSFRASLEPKKA